MAEDPLDDGRKFCGAQLRRQPGRTCRRAPAPDRRRCRHHGGASPRGLEHPSWKHGRYSSLPPALAARVQAARHDPDLVNLTDEVALVDARLGGLLAEKRIRWSDVLESIEMRRRLVLAVTRCEVQRGALVSASSVEATVVALLDLVRTRLSESDFRQVSAEWSKWLESRVQT